MTTPASEPVAPPVAHLELKATLLLVLVLLLLAGAVLYVLYARGTFEETQRLNLIADDAEGVVVGMDMTFSGFPIGRVRAIELARDGSARIVVDLPVADAHWLRTSSVFTLTRSIVGGSALRAYTGIPTDPPLPADATRKVLVGDATAEIPRLIADVRTLVQHLNDITAPESSLAASLANLQQSTARLAGPRGALGLLLGKDADPQRVASAIARSDALLARLDALVAKADRQVFGSDGALPEVRASIAQLNALLGDARATLGHVDAVLAQAQGAASNLRSATTDLGPLRAEVEASLRRVQALIDEVNRKWPFARDTEIRLP
jgi:phospholipid/cholesterol/gamma-HCH transport system substrate-binding protein